MEYSNELQNIEDFELPDGSIYNGEGYVRFGMLEISGQGTVKYPNGDLYTGSFKYGRPYGWGKYKFSNGHSHKGFFDTFPNGIGYLNEDYAMSLGNFVDGKLEGWAIRYAQRVFKFGYWENGKLIDDKSNMTLGVRKAISDGRMSYRGNLIQIPDSHELIRFGIPQKLLGERVPGIPDSMIPKLPAVGFEFLKDGSVKVGHMSTMYTSEYILFAKDRTIQLGKWKNNVLTRELKLSDFQKPESMYEEDGLEVF